ncbi:MAG: hypothetical protein Q4C91_03955 [Eubacteriales bacterium]|nr:hypothetical protein [Eubacteriales bacterium]
MTQYINKTSMVKIFNNKVGTFLLIILVTAWSYDQPYLRFVQEKQYPISWCIFPFYLISFGFLSLFYFGIIYINSDVPFMQHANMYQVIRTGRKKWAAGQIGGIFIRSFVITLLSAVIAILPFMGKLELTNEWGKVVYSLASERIQFSEFILENNLEFRFNYEILEEFTPMQLMVITILLCTFICTFLGMVMFVLSLFAGRVVAVSGALVFVVLLFFVQNAPEVYKRPLAHFVPTYWGEVALIATPGSAGYYRLPSLTYMFSFLIIAILAMSAIVLFRVKHIEFNWENEDA